MQTYDALMLLVLVAAGVWGYWKGFVWQLASLASIFFSYFLAFGLREQVAKLIDAPPPWNMFAAMGIVYAISSLIIWVGTGFASDVLSTFRLKDFDRQIGATFGVAKGMIFCLLITLFAVTLLGERQQERICTSTSGRFIARLLRSSGGLIPRELHAVVDPYLSPLEQKLDHYQQSPTEWAQQPTPQTEQGTANWNAGQLIQQAATAYQQSGYAPNYPPQHQQPQYPPPQYAYPQYDPRYAQPAYPQGGYYDPRYAPPAYEPRYQPAPQYDPSAYQNSYPSAPAYDNYAPREYDLRSYPAPADQRGDYRSTPQYAPQAAYQDDPRYYGR